MDGDEPEGITMTLSEQIHALITTEEGRAAIRRQAFGPCRYIQFPGSLAQIAHGDLLLWLLARVEVLELSLAEDDDA